MTISKILGVLVILGVALCVSIELDDIETQKIALAHKVHAIHVIANCEADGRKWKYYEGSDDLICYIFPETK